VGIYDRDYYRQEDQRGFSPHLPHSVVGMLILINVAIWLADAFTPARGVGNEVFGRWLSDHLAAHVDTLTQPWFWWQFLTAGFTHAPLGSDNGVGHLVGNMLVLFFLGRSVEDRYGPKEFLRFYLVTLVLANVAWCVVGKLTHVPGDVGIVGASGAIAGVVVLFAFNFPNVTVLLFFVIPMPAWVLGVGIVAYDLYGAMGGVRGSNVAYVAHVAGAAFALLYFQRNWNLTRLTDRIPLSFGSLFRSRPRLRVHNPPPDDEPRRQPPPPPTDNLAADVDRILEKIYREGEASLTAKERSTLEAASRKYQERRGK
jgi:membrane associated rhomboid family serine protease